MLIGENKKNFVFISGLFLLILINIRNIMSRLLGWMKSVLRQEVLWRVVGEKRGDVRVVLERGRVLGNVLLDLLKFFLQLVL